MEWTCNNAIVTWEVHSDAHFNLGIEGSRLSFSLAISFWTSILLLIAGASKLSVCKPCKDLTLLNATYACPGLKWPPFMSTTISSRASPCTLWMVVAHAKVKGNCNLVISDPLLPLARNTTSCLHTGTVVGCMLWWILDWIAYIPTWLLSNLTNIVVTSLLTLVTMCTTLPLAPLTRPSDTSTLVVSITLAPTANLSTPCNPPVSDLFLSRNCERSTWDVC